MGAENAGLQTAFVARPGKTLYPHAERPDYIVNDISELASILRNATPAAGSRSE